MGMIGQRAAKLLVFLLFAGMIGPGMAKAEDNGRVPLSLPDAHEFYQRILTLPGAQLKQGPSADGPGTQIPTFSVFYVWAQRDGWLQIGQDLKTGPTGWVSAETTQPWSIMLTMKYAPVGQRGRAMFFEHVQDLRDITRMVDSSAVIHRLQADIDANRATDPQLVSVEPPDARGLPRESQYLIPITGFENVEFDNGNRAHLLKVALLNAEPPPPPPPPVKLQAMQGAVVFVLDTTVSMKPFFERSIQSIRTVLQSLKDSNLDGKVGVGIVAYRNSVKERPGLLYDVKVIQPLTPGASLDKVMTAAASLDEAKVSSHSVSEDAISGLWTAINFDWTPFKDAPKAIYLVTDAGALDGNDKTVKFPGVGILNVVEAANRTGIAIYPLHVASEISKKANNVPGAKRQYMQLAQATGDNLGNPNQHNYTLIDPGSPEHFSAIMDGFDRATIQVFKSWGQNKAVESQSIAASDSDTVKFAKTITNNLFNAQQKFIGSVGKTQSKEAMSAWVSDKDLIKPDAVALNVSVYLTRNQLSQLALSARRLYDAGREQQVSNTAMFRQLQALSAQTSQDPERFKGEAQKVADMGLLPGFLKLLPYRSDFLSLTEDRWAHLTTEDQAAALTRLAFKIRSYADMNADQDHWENIGNRDSGLAVRAVPLEYLP